MLSYLDTFTYISTSKSGAISQFTKHWQKYRILCFHLTSEVTWWGVPPPYWVTSKLDLQNSNDYTIPVKSNVGLNDHFPFCSCENIGGLRATVHNQSSLLIRVSKPSSPLNMEGNVCGWLLYLCWYWHDQTEECRACSDDFEPHGTWFNCVWITFFRNRFRWKFELHFFFIFLWLLYFFMTLSNKHCSYTFANYHSHRTGLHMAWSVCFSKTQRRIKL